MTDQVWKWILCEKLIEPGDHVIVGVSGGADSVCLLLLLEEWRKRLGCTLSAVHVEHGIRGEESREDARFVRELCEQHGIPCEIYAVDVPETAKRLGLGLEEAARIRRYECYREEAARLLANGTARVRIALAHHADDNAETILFQMVRGSGLTGLCGMQPARELTEGVTLIRPLLGVSRRDIEDFLTKHGQTYRVDSTNSDVNYSRNRLRHRVMPQLEQINSQAAAHISQCGARLMEVRDYLNEQVEILRSQYCLSEERAVVLGRELFEVTPALLVRELIHQELVELSGGGKDLGEIHVEAVRQLAVRQVGRSLTLPAGICAERIYPGVRLWRTEKTDDGAETGNRPFCAAREAGMPACSEQAKSEVCEISLERLAETESGEALVVPLDEKELRLKVHRARDLFPQENERDFLGKIRESGKKTYTKWLNYDKMKCSLLLRKRQSGDYLVVDEAGHKKKLKAYFIDEKIPQALRDHIWLLAEQSHIAWVIGGRMSAGYRVAADTERILEVQLIGGKEDED